jgi:ribosomal protein S18 acetylase RimI-like enzyme
MAFRALQIPQDVDVIIDLVTESFQYPENPEWGFQEDEKELIIESAVALRKIWPLIRIGRVFSPMLRDLFLGYLAENEERGEKEAQALVMIQRRGSSDNWLVGTVATHPKYRRRGLARKLVNMSINLIREKGGKQITLDVIAQNYPAYKLYEALGFEHFTSSQELVYNPGEPISVPALPESFQLEETSRFNWRPRVALLEQITPMNIQKFEPIDPARFQTPLFLRLLVAIMNRLQHVKEKMFFIYQGETMVGYARYQARTDGRGRHGISLVLDPAVANDKLAKTLLCWLLSQVQARNSDLLVETSLAVWNKTLITTAFDLGFEKRMEFHRMGLKMG